MIEIPGTIQTLDTESIQLKNILELNSLEQLQIKARSDLKLMGRLKD